MLKLLDIIGSGGWIRTNDLRVMSPTSYQTAPPRIKYQRKNIAVAWISVKRLTRIY